MRNGGHVLMLNFVNTYDKNVRNQLRNAEAFDKIYNSYSL